MNELFPTHGRIAGIDFGTVRIGVAVTDPDRTISSPYATYTREEEAALLEWFRRFVLNEQIVGLVVGLPVYPSGDESPKSQEARQFGTWLHNQLNIPVAYFDERYSTVEAEAVCTSAKLTKKKRKKRLDALAAQIILTSYLESYPSD